MKQAKRLFARSKRSNTQKQNSAAFRSKLERDLPNQSRRNSLGPGQYNISLPFVKPKFEAIRKSNNTIIVKVNQKHSPAFQSLEPRFKQPKVMENFTPQNQLQIYEGKNKSQRDSSAYNKQIEQGMRMRIKKLTQILHYEEKQSRRKNIMSLDGASTDKLERLKDSVQTINSLKLYKKERERLHFLLKNMKSHDHTKGVQWSKYRETKGNLYNISKVPGPGTYQEAPLKSTRYYDTIDQKSWQFKSVTRRAYYPNCEEKIYQICLSQNKFVSDINGKFHKVESIPLLHDKSVTKIGFDIQQN